MTTDILRSNSSDARPRDSSCLHLVSMSQARAHETYICISSPVFTSNMELIGGDEKKELE